MSGATGSTTASAACAAPPASVTAAEQRPSPPVHCRRHCALWDRVTRWIKAVMPKGLYARALLIIIVPMVVLQSVVAFVFMERHWSLVTRHLSAAVTQDIAALIDVYKSYPQDADYAQLRRIAQDRLGLVVDFLPADAVAAARAEAVLLAARSGAVATRSASRSAGRSGSTPSAARRSSRSASSSTTRSCGSSPAAADAYDVELRIFLLWMVGDLARAARRRHPVPAQPDPADPAAGRRRRELRQGPRGAEFPPARRARSAARGRRLPRNEAAHRARDRAAHRRCSPASSTICARC